jgi:hypothetical protein
MDVIDMFIFFLVVSYGISGIYYRWKIDFLRKKGAEIEVRKHSRAVGIIQILKALKNEKNIMFISEIKMNIYILIVNRFFLILAIILIIKVMYPIVFQR